MQTILDDQDWSDLAQSCCDEISLDPAVGGVWALRWENALACEELGRAGSDAILDALQAHQWCEVQDGELLTLALASPLRHLPPKHMLRTGQLESAALSHVQDIILIPVLEQNDLPWTFILMLRQPLHSPDELARRLQQLWDAQGRNMQRRLIGAACEQAGNSMFITDSEGDIVWTNQAFTTLTGYSAAQAIGRNPRFLNSGKQSDRYYRRLWQTIRSGQVWSSEAVDKDRFGYLYTIQQTISPVRTKNEIAYYLSVHDDISQRKNLEIRSERQQHVECTSGLLTPAAFHDSLAEHLRKAEAVDQTFAVISFSLSNFTSVQNSLNEDARNVLLREIGVRIRVHLPKTASAGYFSNGDFGLCLPLNSREAAESFMQKLHKALNDTYPILEASPYFGISQGIAMYPEDGHNPDALWKAADSANGAP